MNKNKDEEFYSIKKVINNFFSNIDENQIEKGLTLSKIWEDTIKKIYKYGPKLEGHTKIVDLKNEILLVETDHPGWNQILQNNKSFILKGLKMQIKDLNIKTIVFRVKGNQSKISDDYEKIEKQEKEKMLKELENNQKKLEQMGFKNEIGKKEIPGEVKDLFKEVLK